jgi:hypothetical protein
MVLLASLQHARQWILERGSRARMSHYIPSLPPFFVGVQKTYQVLPWIQIYMSVLMSWVIAMLGKHLSLRTNQDLGHGRSMQHLIRQYTLLLYLMTMKSRPITFKKC